MNKQERINNLKRWSKNKLAEARRADRALLNVPDGHRFLRRRIELRIKRDAAYASHIQALDLARDVANGIIP